MWDVCHNCACAGWSVSNTPNTLTLSLLKQGKQQSVSQSYKDE